MVVGEADADAGGGSRRAWAHGLPRGRRMNSAYGQTDGRTEMNPCALKDTEGRKGERRRTEGRKEEQKLERKSRREQKGEHR